MKARGANTKMQHKLEHKCFRNTCTRKAENQNTLVARLRTRLEDQSDASN